jgi:hypothetical protein
MLLEAGADTLPFIIEGWIIFCKSQKLRIKVKIFDLKYSAPVLSGMRKFVIKYSSYAPVQIESGSNWQSPHGG